MDDHSAKTATVRVLCRNLVFSGKESDVQWLIGSPFFPSFTVVSTLRCIHYDLPSSSSPNLGKESDDLRKLLPKGFEVIGALILGNSNSEKNTVEVIAAARSLRKLLSGGELDDEKMIVALSAAETGDLQFLVSKNENSSRLEPVSSVMFEDKPEKYVWEMGCLLHCELPVKLPFYYPAKSSSDAEKMFLHASETVLAKLKEPHVAYMFEPLGKLNGEVPKPVILRGRSLDAGPDFTDGKTSEETTQDAKTKALSCAHFCQKSKSFSGVFSAESADKIEVSVLLNRSEKSPNSTAPVAEYLPATEEARLVVVDFKLDVLCYALKDLPLMYAVVNLLVPALADQLNSMKKMILPSLLRQHPQSRAYHFSPPGVLHPVTTIYELNYGETEMKQVDVRKSLHLRLGLPLDRPLLRIVNALDLSSKDDDSRRNQTKRGSTLLKDVHIGIPSSGVSAGVSSLVQGSYDYHHYLQDGIDDSGWGCAYRSLQTIISWFRLQHYTFIDVPSHRDIQQTLVDIGDKDPSFIGSREWIGAIELSFVLDKLLGVSCKIMNVRSGSELPEKCRELAMHFETQGTPVMIGGGVLAYTLLGVDYNEGSGDCAFLILDPHYTGSDDHKKIVNGGWVGWKKAVDSKGKKFFLHDKFYNLLLPQRPNMV